MISTLTREYYLLEIYSAITVHGAVCAENTTQGRSVLRGAHSLISDKGKQQGEEIGEVVYGYKREMCSITLVLLLEWTHTEWLCMHAYILYRTQIALLMQ